MLTEKLIITEIHSVISLEKEKDWSYDKSVRTTNGLVLTETCRHIYTQDGVAYQSTPESALLLPKGSSYHIDCTGDGVDYLIDFEALDQSRVGDRLLALPTDKSAELIRDVRRMMLPGKHISTGYQQLSIFYSILSRLTYAGKSGPEANSMIAPSLDLIRDNFTLPGLTLADLAAPSKISVAYFRQLFFGTYGVSPMKYVNGLRIARAKKLLSSGCMNITETALACGWSNVYSFSGFFRKVTGHSPSEYLNGSISD